MNTESKIENKSKSMFFCEECDKEFEGESIECGDCLMLLCESCLNDHSDQHWNYS